MSERKVLSKYYPPDFDPSKLTRQRGPKPPGPKVQTVRLMAPFSMKCSSCGEYIYKGRKFNARKETTDEKYLSIPIFRFYIRCTRCSAEITFTTDPKNLDYKCEKGAARNFEPWRTSDLKEETEEERLDRLEEEEKERDSMAVLEAKTLDAKTEMAVADALDEIRTRNARLERASGAEPDTLLRDEDGLDQEPNKEDLEDDELAKQAFRGRVDERLLIAAEVAPETETTVPTFTRARKKKKDYSAALGIKKAKISHLA